MSWLIDNLGFIGWIICGFVAYGITKGDFVYIIKKYSTHNNDDGYTVAGEFLCLVSFLAGYAGLLMAIVMSLSVGKFSWCLKAPKELTKRFWEIPKLW